MGDSHADKPAGKGPRSLIPLPIPLPVDERAHNRQFFMQQPSLWQLCKQWLRYHSIQIRWDIERTVARLFHRRWGV
ncbi:MAG TPA: hypothetical protein VFQ30_01405 [Ktedonobacteraceae bacterium]|nr:hypothetical protein [Ktedonobacteraceae bacterium]